MQIKFTIRYQVVSALTVKLITLTLQLKEKVINIDKKLLITFCFLGC